MDRFNVGFVLKSAIVILLSAFQTTSLASQNHDSEFQKIFLAALHGDLKDLEKHLANADKPIGLSKPESASVALALVRCRYRSENQIRVLEVLSDEGVDFNYVTDSGDGLFTNSSCNPNTKASRPTSLAPQENTVEIAKFLISKGANTKRQYDKTNNGLTALRTAILNKNEPLAIFLLPYSDVTEGDIGAAKRANLSSLITTIINDNRELYSEPLFRWALQEFSTDPYREDVFIALLNKGIDQNEFLNEKGLFKHPIIQATRRGNLEAVKLLTQYGAKLDVKDKHGRNLIDISKKYGYESLEAFFKSLGLHSADEG